VKYVPGQAEDDEVAADFHHPIVVDHVVFMLSKGIFGRHGEVGCDETYSNVSLQLYMTIRQAFKLQNAYHRPGSWLVGR
jgi:hypothetical protein